MGALLPAPAEVRAEFGRLLARDAEAAVTYLHDLGTTSGYIDEAAVARNIRWTAASAFGELELTINLSKPEKDPRAIAAAAKQEAAFGAKGTAQVNGAAAAKDAATSKAAARAEATAISEAVATAMRPATFSGAPASPGAPAGPGVLTGPGAPAGLSVLTGRGVPRCDLCWENEGFPGTPEHPAKPGLRIAAIELGGERWGLQFSPYAYFDEHCIALAAEHRPMKIDAAGMERLLDFADLFPFYFVGSNADLPIVGGSILSHDHFQGGRHTFPLMKAPVERIVSLAGLPQVRCGIVRWPASTLRLRSLDRAALARAAARILEAWRGFSFEPCSIVAHDADGLHSTLNPIVHREGADYVMHLVLRNNRADAERPWGVFHPGAELHHIKKENIGLIEIMGLAILPPRLARELPLVQRALVEAARTGRAPQEVEARLRAHEDTAPHAAWAAGILSRRRDELFFRETRLNHCKAELVRRETQLNRCKAELAHRNARFDLRRGELADQKSDLATTTPHSVAPPAPILRDGTARPNVQPASCETIHPVLCDEVARAFTRILATTGVFKRDATGAAGWDAFLAELEQS